MRDVMDAILYLASTGCQWAMLLEGASDIFQRGRNPGEPEADAGRIKDLHAKIGELTVERDFLEQGLRLLPGGSARR